MILETKYYLEIFEMTESIPRRMFIMIIKRSTNVSGYIQFAWTLNIIESFLFSISLFLVWQYSFFFSFLIFSFCYILDVPYFLYLRFFSDSYIYLLPQFFSPHRILFHCLLPRPPLLTTAATPPCFPRSIFLFFASFHSIRPTSSFLLSLFSPPILFRFPFAYSTSLQRRTLPSFAALGAKLGLGEVFRGIFFSHLCIHLARYFIRGSLFTDHWRDAFFYLFRYENNGRCYRNCR